MARAKKQTPTKKPRITNIFVRRFLSAVKKVGTAIKKLFKGKAKKKPKNIETPRINIVQQPKPKGPKVVGTINISNIDKNPWEYYKSTNKRIEIEFKNAKRSRPFETEGEFYQVLGKYTELNPNTSIKELTKQIAYNRIKVTEKQTKSMLENLKNNIAEISAKAIGDRTDLESGMLEAYQKMIDSNGQGHITFNDIWRNREVFEKFYNFLKDNDLLSEAFDS